MKEVKTLRDVVLAVVTVFAIIILILIFLLHGNNNIVIVKFIDSVTGGTVLLSTNKEKQKPQVTVEYNLEVEKMAQKSVDAGHSPWRLDPAFVAQVFVSLMIYPEGIQGEYPIPYEDITIRKNDGVEAIAEINTRNTPATRVYLKQLIRQDENGIWTVIGYDKGL